MNKYISLLRGINVGGKRKILMKDLKVLYEDLGFSNIITYIQSGNVIFETDKKNNEKESALIIKKAIFKTYGYDVPVIVRSDIELKKVFTLNPFLKSIDPDISTLGVSFLEDIPSVELKKNTEVLGGNIAPNDKFRIINNHIYILCAGKYSQSKLTNTFFESKLKMSVTTRNWKTVIKLIELVS